MFLWMLLGLGCAVLEWPYQTLSELGFRLQRWGWPLTGLDGGSGSAQAHEGVATAVVAVIGGAAGLGVPFRSPLLAAAYALEELGRRRGVGVLGPVLLVSGAGALISTSLGQPARLAGLQIGVLATPLWGWTVLFTLAGAALGVLLVRLAIPASALVRQRMVHHRLLGAGLLALVITALAVLSAGLSLNDGSLSLAAALAGNRGGPPFTLLWRALTTLASLAVGAPGGLMHESMTLGALFPSLLPLKLGLSTTQLGQLAAVGAVALFTAAHQGTPLFCSAFVFTLQGDPQALPALLLVSAVSSALGAHLRGEGWNGHQCATLLGQIAGHPAGPSLSAPPVANGDRLDRSPAAPPEIPASGSPEATS